MWLLLAFQLLVSQCTLYFRQQVHLNSWTGTWSPMLFYVLFSTSEVLFLLSLPGQRPFLPGPTPLESYSEAPGWFHAISCASVNISSTECTHIIWVKYAKCFLFPICRSFWKAGTVLYILNTLFDTKENLYIHLWTYYRHFFTLFNLNVTES